MKMNDINETYITTDYIITFSKTTMNNPYVITIRFNPSGNNSLCLYYHDENIRNTDYDRLVKEFEGD